MAKFLTTLSVLLLAASVGSASRILSGFAPVSLSDGAA